MITSISTIQAPRAESAVRFGIVAQSVGEYLAMKRRIESMRQPAPKPVPKPESLDERMVRLLDAFGRTLRTRELLRSPKKTANMRKALAKRAERGSHNGKR